MSAPNKVTNDHNWLHFWPPHCDRLCDIKTYLHKKFQKETVKKVLSILKPAALRPLLVVSKRSNKWLQLCPLQCGIGSMLF
jgi:hypothetical protein